MGIGGRVRSLALLVFAMVLTAGHGFAAASEDDQAGETPRPRIGLVLSGGGARGAAHLGVLQVLEEYRIPIDCIAGTSMGAIVGGLYASGMTLDEMEVAISQVGWAEAFVDRIPRVDRSFRRKRDDDLYLVKNRPGVSIAGLHFPTGIIDGQSVDMMLKRLTLPVVTVRDFDELVIPYRAIATDLVTGEMVVLSSGDLAQAVRASMSIPILFAPREVDGRLLVDGGPAANLPIAVAREMGADIIIAVDISTPLQEREELDSILAVTDQILGMLTRRDTEDQIETLTQDDVFILPDLGDITTGSFDRASEAIPKGVDAAMAVADQLRRLSLPPDQYQRPSDRRDWPSQSPIIHEIRAINDSRLADGVILERLSARAGERLDVSRLEQDLAQIYGLELFESVYYDITEEDGKTVLTITVRARSWGPNYLQLGAAVFEDYESPNFNVAAAYTRTTINGLGGEWRAGFQIGQEPGVFTELYQPLDYGLHKFLSVRASFGQSATKVFDREGNVLSELGWTRHGVELAVGRELGAWGELRLGLERAAGNAAIQVGDPEIAPRDFDTGELFAQYSFDEMDDLSFPSSGAFLRTRVTAGRTDLGSEVDYEQASGHASLAHSFGRIRVLLSGALATTGKKSAPLQSQFRLGGFTALAGLERNELVGQHAALATATFYRKLWDSTLLPTYAGFSVEYGNIFEKRDHIALNNGIASGKIFIGLDTYIGPVFFGYGVAESGRVNLYMSLGQSILFGGPGSAGF